MQTPRLGSAVLYREGSHEFVAIVTNVRTDGSGPAGRVDLAVFAAASGCVGRYAIPHGDGPGRWKPLPDANEHGEPTPGKPLLENVERELVELRSQVEQLQAAFDALTKTTAALIERANELAARANAPAQPAETSE